MNLREIVSRLILTGLLNSSNSVKWNYNLTNSSKCAASQPTWTSSVVCTMNMSCRSSMAPSIQLLKGADLLANSRNNWSIVSSSLSVRWGDYKISHICCIFLNPKKPITSNLYCISALCYTLNLGVIMFIAHKTPKTNIPSPVLMTNPRAHNIGMALLTPDSGLVVPDSVPTLRRGWRVVEEG